MRQEFENGSVVLTGDDLTRSIEAMLNHRGAYDIDCSFCKHENNEDFCDGCTISDTNYSCSCHINPPCSKCVGSKFEVSEYLINYTNHKDGKKKWECFKAGEDIFDKATLIETSGLRLSAEILSTGEVAMYIDDGIDAGENDAIEICERKNFKQIMCKMIKEY